MGLKVPSNPNLSGIRMMTAFSLIPLNALHVLGYRSGVGSVWGFFSNTAMSPPHLELSPFVLEELIGSNILFEVVLKE